MLVEVVRLGGVSTARITFQPGWRWSESVRPWSEPIHASYGMSGRS